MTCRSKCRASKARRHQMVACSPYPCSQGPTPAPCTMSRGRLLSASLAFRWGADNVVARVRGDGRSVASGGGHVTAVSSYIAYARALNRLGWTPAEFVVASRLPCSCAACWDGVRSPPMACRLSWGFPGLFLSHVFYGLSHRHRLHQSRRQYPRALRKRPSLAHVLLPRRRAALERPSIIVSTPALQRVPA